MNFDETEAARRKRLAEVNLAAAGREELEERHGKVWDSQELRNEFEVIGFSAPWVIVRRKSDGVKGSLEFQHDPRFYFDFRE
jgi:hypothetical protein